MGSRKRPFDLRAWFAERAVRAERRMNCERREQALEDAGARSAGLLELHAFVHTTAATAPDNPERYEVEALLDAYVTTEIARHRCIVQLGNTMRETLHYKLQQARYLGQQQSVSVIQRRIEMHDRLEASVIEHAGRLAALVLLVQRHCEQADRHGLGVVVDGEPLDWRVTLLDATVE